MYYTMYQAIKQAIAPEGGSTPVEWFNNQYDVAAHGCVSLPDNVPHTVFVEFDPLEINRTTKLGGQTSIGIRLHIVTPVIPGASEAAPLLPVAIPDALAEQNEVLARQVATAAEGITLPFGETETRPLLLTGWEQVCKHNGWIVTLVSFRTKG